MKQGPPPLRGSNHYWDPCRYFQGEKVSSGWVEVSLKELEMYNQEMSRVSVWKEKSSEGFAESDCLGFCDL